MINENDYNDHLYRPRSASLIEIDPVGRREE